MYWSVSWFYSLIIHVDYLMPNPVYTYEVHTISF